MTQLPSPEEMATNVIRERWGNMNDYAPKTEQYLDRKSWCEAAVRADRAAIAEVVEAWLRECDFVEGTSFATPDVLAYRKGLHQVLLLLLAEVEP